MWFVKYADEGQRTEEALHMVKCNKSNFVAVTYENGFSRVNIFPRRYQFILIWITNKRKI